MAFGGAASVFGPEFPIEALLVSTGIVALAETGDKTQAVMFAALGAAALIWGGRASVPQGLPYTRPAPICSSLRALNKFS